MIDEKEKVISKVRKILALTTNNYGGEAEAAMLKAQKLLMEHNLSMQDVTDANEKPEIVELELEYNSTPWWYKYLIGIIADNFRCEAMERCFHMSRRKAFLLIGREDDAAVAREIFKYAVVLIKHNRKPFRARGTACENAYINGFLSGLIAKFKEQVKQNEWGLVLVKDKEVVEAKQKHNPVTPRKVPIPTTADDPIAYARGYVDGKTLNHDRKQIEAV